MRARCTECTTKKKDAYGGRYGQGSSDAGSGVATHRGRLVCFDFQKGCCQRGDSCKFAHGEVDGTLERDGTSGSGAPKSSSEEEAAVRCYNCSKLGHRSRDCPNPQSVATCYACGQNGHTARECSKSRGVAACFHCGKPGHLSRQCPEAPAPGACFNCGKAGHLAKDCMAPPKGAA